MGAGASVIPRASWTYDGPTQTVNGTWTLKPVTCTRGVFGTFRVIVGATWDTQVGDDPDAPPALDVEAEDYDPGVDITAVSGVRSLIRSMTWGEPYGEIDATVELPRVREYDAPEWLLEGANIDIYWVVPDDQAVALELDEHPVYGGYLLPHWHGFVAAIPVASGPGKGIGTTLRCLGALFGEISHRDHQPVFKSAARDVGQILQMSLYPRDYARPFNDFRFRFTAVETGIEVRRRGSRGQKIVNYVDEVLGMAQDDDGQWTVSRKYDANGFPIARWYYLRRKGGSWADAIQATTFTVGGYGIDTSGVRDLTTTANVINGEGVNPLVDGKGGDRYRNAKYPADFPAQPAYPDRSVGSTYPVTMGDNDGDFTATVISQLQYALRLGSFPDVEITGEFDVDTATALIELQTDAGVTVTGEVGSDAEWDLIFETVVDSADLDAYFRPFSEVLEAAQYLTAPNGAVLGPNPDYDRRLRIERMISFGEGIKFKDARVFARRLAQQSLGGVPFVGDIKLTSDPEQMSRYLVHEGGWTRASGLRGNLADLYVAAVQQEPESPGAPVTITGAERAWDLLDLQTRRGRDYEAQQSPGASFKSLRDSPGDPFANALGWDKESGAGLIPPFHHPGGEWVVVKMRAAQQGLIQAMRVRTRNDPCDHAIVIFGKAVAASEVAAIAPDPFAEVEHYGSPFNDPANEDALQALGIAGMWGQEGSPGGRSPGHGIDAPITGDSIDEMNWPFVSWNDTDLYVAFYAVSECDIDARFKVQPTDEG